MALPIAKINVMSDPRFEPLLTRMQLSGIAAADDLRGCTDVEIARLEKRYGLTLPFIYQNYLRIMGHGAGKLFSHDHMAVTYPNVFDMTLDFTTDWRAENAAAPGTSPELPANALIIAGRLADQFNFICCEGQYDCPVYYINTLDKQAVEAAPSLLDWLEGCCAAAEAAIASGYFLDNPKGTGA